MAFGATITGLGAYVPSQRLTNADLAKRVDTDDHWIVTRTGIRERRIVDASEGTMHLAARAGREALAHAGIEPEDLDLIIVATTTPDLGFPPTAALVQGKLGAKNAAAFDINAVCSGFLQAYITAAQFIQAGAYQRILVIGAETLSRIVDYNDRSTCILFGDGAGAAVVERSDARYGLLDWVMYADGTGAPLVYCPRPDTPPATLQAIGGEPDPTIKQHGRAVFKVAVNGMTESVQLLLDRNGLSPEDIRVIVPHQANIRIMNAVAERLGLKQSQVATCIAEYGNTSAATIPLALHKWYHTEGLKPGDLVVFTAFAAGLLWGAALLRWGGGNG